MTRKDSHRSARAVRAMLRDDRPVPSACRAALQAVAARIRSRLAGDDRRHRHAIALGLAARRGPAPLPR